MTHYIRNKNGGIHSVDDDTYENRLLETEDGRQGPSALGTKYLPRGYEEISEDEARKAHPQLFGAHDPLIVKTPEELKAQVEHARLTAELYNYDPATAADPSAGDPATPEA